MSAKSAAEAEASPHARLTAERMRWWRDARFGLFVHWGIYSVLAGSHHGRPISGIGEWIMLHGKIPVAEYRDYARHFNPVRLDPEAWASLAELAGMRYLIITGKHHDGFALFDSRVTDWDILDATPYGHDALAPLAAAARRRGLRFGVYYSQAQDWTHPGGAKWQMADGDGWDDAHRGRFDDYLTQIAVPQVEELLTGFDPDVLWWDTPHLMTPERAARLYRFVAERPSLITNDRLGGGYRGHFDTPEQVIPATGIPGRDWEVCMTMNDTWGYRADDHNWKSTQELVRMLCDIASKGGNFLLNVGPTSDGEIPAPSIERLTQIGGWMKVNGESIHGTSASPLGTLPWGRATTKRAEVGTTLYLHVFDWPGDGRLSVPGLQSGIEEATLLETQQRLAATSGGEGTLIDLPPRAPDPYASVIKLQLADQLG